MEKRLVYELDEVRDYEWLSYGGDANILIESDEDCGNAAKEWGVSVEMVKEIRVALKFMAETIIDAVKADLKSVYDLVE